MTTIPPEFIRTLIDRSDIVETISPHVNLKQKGANWWGLCPFHTEKTPSFAVNPNKGFYHCFGCGAHGDALSFIKHIRCGGDFMASVEMLAAMQGLRVPREGRKGDDDSEAKEKLLHQALAHWRGRLREHAPALNYLRQRGVSEETIERFALGYADDDWHGLTKALPDADKKRLIAVGLLRDNEGKRYDYFRGRVIFPIFELNERLRGFGGRTLGDEEPKYLNSPDTAGFSKRHILYALPLAATAARRKNRLIVCEGYMDAVMLSQNGFEESVATMGTAATAEQMRKATRLAANLIFAYDGDEAGRRGAWRAMENILPSLRDGVGVSFLFLPERQDPDSYIREHGNDAFEAQIAAAVPLSDFIVNGLWDKTSVANEEGASSDALLGGERLLRLLSTEDAKYLRELLAEKLAQRAKINASLIRNAARKPDKRPRAQLRMPPHDKLFVLLCFFEVRPHLIQWVDTDTPLPGNDMREVELVAEVSAKLRWAMEEEPPTVSSMLQEMGYVALARQVRSEAGQRFRATVEVEADFRQLLESFQRESRKKSKAGKREWLARLNSLGE